MIMNSITTFDDIVAREGEFQLATYKKLPVAAVRGRGAWVETSEGERFLDLYGGHAVAATGHCHPHVVEAVRAQAGELLFYSNLVYSEVRARAAERLVSCAPGGLKKVLDRKSTRLNSSHANISYAVFCLKKKKIYAISFVHPF